MPSLDEQFKMLWAEWSSIYSDCQCYNSYKGVGLKQTNLGVGEIDCDNPNDNMDINKLGRLMFELKVLKGQGNFTSPNQDMIQKIEKQFDTCRDLIEKAYNVPGINKPGMEQVQNSGDGMGMNSPENSGNSMGLSHK